MNKKIGVGLVCASLLVLSTQALAWGDRERAALWGVVGGAVLANSWNEPSPQVHEYPAVTVYSPPPRVIEYQPVYSPPPRYVMETPYTSHARVVEVYERERVGRHHRQERREYEADERGHRGSWGDWR
jgi:hypothetical protein